MSDEVFDIPEDYLITCLPESTFTPPREECPHPELWLAWDTDSSEMEVSEFVGAFVRLLKPAFVLETGSCFGYTTLEIGMALRGNDYGRCVSLEIDPRRAQIAAERCADLPVEIVMQSSLEYEPPQEVDFAFLDSDPPIRAGEWERFRPRFALIHDSGKHKSIRADIEQLDMRHFLPRTVFFPTPRGLCLIDREA